MSSPRSFRKSLAPDKMLRFNEGRLKEAKPLSRDLYGGKVERPMHFINSQEEDSKLVRTRQSLVERLKDLQDQQSWRDFFSLYWRLIYGVAVSSGFSPAEAEDILQETVIAVSRSIERFKSDPVYGSFKSWLLRITHRKMIDSRRKRKCTPAGGYDEDPALKADEVPPSQEFEQLWDAEWNRAVMASALEKLKLKVPPKQFQVFFLQVIKETPAAETSQIVGVNVAQVYLLKHRLSRVFKECLQEAHAQLNA